MLQNYYQTKKLNKKLVERQVKRPVEKKVKDNIKELETNKEKGGVHQLVYFESLAIMVVVKKHGNNFWALHFLKTTYRKPGVPSLYEKLGKASLWDWLHPIVI